MFSQAGSATPVGALTWYGRRIPCMARRKPAANEPWEPIFPRDPT
jgi:hypothetical protein